MKENFFEVVEKKTVNKYLKLNVALYFFGSLAEVYQVEQWLPVLEELNKIEPISIVVRNNDIRISLNQKTNIPILYFNTINQLLEAYQESNFKVILYVNNGSKNFHSLLYHGALHIHLNHGESEKASMHSNQCKSYDYTYIVGDAAYDRYKRHILNIDIANYVKIGRPQFDFIKEIKKNSDKKVILYAPTDESTHISMRYTSIDKFGLQIVDTILSNQDYLLVYRPHPRTGKNDEKVNRINREIIKRIKEAENGIVERSLNAIDLLSIVDLAIFDNSSLIIDFLYFNRPMFATDMFNPEYHDIKSFKMLDGCTMLSEENINTLEELIIEHLELDPLKEVRTEIRKYYLGDYKKGESTKLFIKKIKEAMEERDTLLKERELL